MCTIMKITLACLLLVASCASAEHPEDAMVPEENAVQEIDPAEDPAACNVFGALSKKTAVPMNLYRIAGELLEEAKPILAEEFKGVLECHKRSYWTKSSCRTAETKVLDGIKNLEAKKLVDQLAIALKPHAVAFFRSEDGKEITALAKTFGEAKEMPITKAEAFVSAHLGAELGQLLHTLQVPMMKLIPQIAFTFIPGWLLIPGSLRTAITDKVAADAKTAGDTHADLTEKFKELMNKAATHIITVTAIGEVVTKVITDTPAVCAFGLAQQFAMAATASQC